MSNLARSILETVFCFSKSKGNITHPTIDIQSQVPFKIKEITITPYLIDHSAYGAYMFLIEVEGKRILHTGDFRNHGYKGKLLPTTLNKIRQDRYTNYRTALLYQDQKSKHKQRQT